MWQEKLTKNFTKVRQIQWKRHAFWSRKSYTKRSKQGKWAESAVRPEWTEPEECEILDRGAADQTRKNIKG